MHNPRTRSWAIFLFPAVAALAQPTINIQALNSAVVRGPGTPGSGIAQGSIFTVYGSGLGPESGVSANAFPLQTTLGGSSLAVTVGGATVSAIILYAGYYQINAILPSNTPIGSGTFTVTYNNQTSAPASIQVVASAVGIYTYAVTGSGQAVATDVNYGINTIIHTFHPGDYVILWATGLGAINGSDAEVPPTGNIGQVKVYIGNTAASNIYYHGRSGCCAGLDQIIFQIPSGITGCYVPVAVEAGGVTGNIGNVTTIAVSDSGQTCSDSVLGQDLVARLAAGQTVNFGYIRLESELSSFVPGTASFLASLDSVTATFSQYTPQTAGLAEYGVSNGYCVAVDCSYGCFGVNTYNFSLQDSSPAQLDAGTLTIQGTPPVTLNQSGGSYGAQLAFGNRYLWSGLVYPVTATGGTEVGAFNVSDTLGIAGAKFTGISASQTLSRSGDLTVHWSGGDESLDNGNVTIGMYSADSSLALFEAMQCTAPQSAGQFTIPGWMVALLPQSGTGVNGATTYPLGWMWIGQYDTPKPFTATGLDKAIVTDILYNGTGVYFK